jgi:hypothetical protein
LAEKIMEKNPYTDESAPEGIDPSKTLQTRLRSEEASGSLTNTSEEAAQALRRMRTRPILPKKSETSAGRR